MNRILCCFFTLVLTSTLLAQPELDSTFGPGGKMTIIFGATASADDLAIQADNKIVLVSACGSIVVGAMPFCAVRLNEDGSYDHTFQSSASVAGVYTLFGTEVTGVTIQSDGKIVAVGYGSAGGHDNIAIVRWNSDGTPDRSFGIGGKMSTDVTPGAHDRAQKVIVQPDGKILVVGRTANVQFVARYMPNGLLDPLFGLDGIATAALPEVTTTGLSLALQADGKILAGGATSSAFLLTRFHNDGGLDATWDDDGIVTIGVAGSGQGEGFRSIALQTNGHVVALGHSNLLYRFDTNGLIDDTFGSGGSRQALNNPFADPHEVMISPGGRITVVGERKLHAGPGSVPMDYLTARYLSDGAPDTSYSDDGFLDIDVSGSDGAWAVAPDSLGRIVIAGRSSNCCVQNPWELSVFSVARLDAPGPPVGIAGRVIGPSGRPVNGALVTASGGGGFRTTLTNPFGFYRFVPLQTGQVYAIEVHSRRFEFESRNVFVGDDLTGFDLVAESAGVARLK